MNYTSAHDGDFPRLGVPQPMWGAPNDKDREAWYHSIPKAAGARGLGEYEKPDAFYQKQNLLFLPIAKYPDKKVARPYFAVAMNATLFGDKDSRKDLESAPTLRLANLQMPASTVIFLEVGLPDDDSIPGQEAGAFTGSAHGGPENVVARYNKTNSSDLESKREATANFVFGDGHVESIAVKDFLDSGGKAYYPQLQQNNGGGRVSWTMDPEAKP
jgi:prepilin-type processing-associated H-X9-DG protein